MYFRRPIEIRRSDPVGRFHFSIFVSFSVVSVPSRRVPSPSITPPSHSEQQPRHLTTQLAEQGWLRQDVSAGAGIQAGLCWGVKIEELGF